MHLIIYASKHGQTRKICTKILSIMQNKMLETHLMCINDVKSNFNATNYHSILIGMPVYYGHHNKQIIELIKAHKSNFGHIITGLFSVNLTARKKEKSSPNTNPYFKKLLKQCNDWEPDYSQVFAGALQYTKYSFLDRLMIKFIMKLARGPVNTAVNTSFTDWGQVEQFANQYVSVIQKQR